MQTQSPDNDGKLAIAGIGSIASNDAIFPNKEVRNRDS